MNFKFLLFFALSFSSVNLSARWNSAISKPITSFTTAYTDFVMGNSSSVVQKYHDKACSGHGKGIPQPIVSYANIVVNKLGEIFYGFQYESRSRYFSFRKYNLVSSSWRRISTTNTGSVANYPTIKFSTSINRPVVSNNQPCIRMKRYIQTAWQDINYQSIMSETGGIHATAVTYDNVYVSIQLGTAYSGDKSHIKAPSAPPLGFIGEPSILSVDNHNQFTVSLAVDNNYNLYLAYRPLLANASKVDTQKFDRGSWPSFGHQHFFYRFCGSY